MNFKKPEDCRTPDEIRGEIDKIDMEILSLFAIRHQYIEEIVRFKKDENSVVAQERKEQVICQRKSWAAQKGLNAGTFEKIYTILVESNIKHELEILRTKNRSI